MEERKAESGEQVEVGPGEIIASDAVLRISTPESFGIVTADPGYGPPSQRNLKEGEVHVVWASGGRQSGPEKVADLLVIKPGGRRRAR